MTEAGLTSEETRQRLAQRTTPEAVRGEWVWFALTSLLLVNALRRDLMQQFEFSLAGSLIVAAVVVSLLGATHFRRLRVRRPEDYSQLELDAAVRKSTPCGRCGATVFQFEWACPSCGSWRHQLWVRPEFVPFVSVPLVIFLIYGLLVR
jgi:ribosomal protein S27AE